MRIRGEPREIGAVVRHALLRMVQSAAANTPLHTSAASATVTRGFLPETFTLDFHDDGAAGPMGYLLKVASPEEIFAAVRGRGAGPASVYLRGHGEDPPGAHLREAGSGEPGSRDLHCHPPGGYALTSLPA